MQKCFTGMPTVIGHVHFDKDGLHCNDNVNAESMLDAYSASMAALLPSLIRAQAMATRSSSINNLKQVYKSAMILCADNRLFPQTLEAALEYAPMCGICPVSGLPYIWVEGHDENSPANSILMYSEPIDKDGLRLVLHVSGYVDEMDHETFQQEMAETLRTLGR